MTDSETLERTLGMRLEDTPHLKQAFVHRSHLNENAAFPWPSNERLEFLGDSLLNLAVAEMLYSEFPDATEGDLTELRSALVRTETLARVARTLELGRHLQLGRGEEQSGGRNRQRNLAAALEAVVGAVFLDHGFSAARDFVLGILRLELAQVAAQALIRDPKSKLQQLVQAERQLVPVYRTVDSCGPDHDRVFTVEVFAGDTLLGRGTGTSKKAAEQQAARAALDNR